MIWLLRHAHAEDGTPDAARPLSAQGARQAQAAGDALAWLDLGLQACVTSPKLRAVQTARPVCEALGLDLVEDRRLEGGPFDAGAVAAEHGEHVLLVGHEPDLSAAVHTLTGAQVHLPKGALAAVDRGELKALLRPSELEALARR